MRMFLSGIIQEVSERVGDNQSIENFGVNNKTGLEKSERRVSEDISNYKIIRHNYFAYNPYRINVGSIGLFEGEIGAVSPAYIVFKVDENKIVPKLLLNFLKSERGLIEINQHTHGGVRKSLNSTDLGNIEIDIPDINRQKEFISASEKQGITIEKLFEINQDNQDLVKKLRQSILQDAIQGKLVPQNSSDEPASEFLKKIAAEKLILIEEKKIKKGKELLSITESEKPFSLPNGRTRCKLFEIGESFIGLTYSPNDISENGIPVLRSMNIKDGKIKLDNLVRVNKEVKQKLMVEKGDIIICSRNGSKSLVGKSAIIEDINEPMTFGAFMAILKSPCSKYIQYFMQTNFYRNQLFDANTMTINQITQDMLNNFIIPLPPFAEQHRIVAKVDELMKFCDSLEKEITEAKDNGERLMESVLGEVFR